MEIKDLSGREICAIIKSCSDSNVRELNVGNLNIKFGTTPSVGGTQIAPVEGTQPPLLEIVETTPDQKTEQSESFIDSIRSRVDEEIMQTQTLMDDPAQYEEDVVNSLVYGENGGDDT